MSESSKPKAVAPSRADWVVRTLPPFTNFCSRLEVLLYGTKVAQHYGATRATLEKRGQPIGVNDLLIASHARSEGLARVANKASEFVRVPGLEVENWVQPGS